MLRSSNTIDDTIAVTEIYTVIALNDRYMSLTLETNVNRPVSRFNTSRLLYFGPLTHSAVEA